MGRLLISPPPSAAQGNLSAASGIGKWHVRAIPLSRKTAANNIDQ
jgi:hypothetical protein